MFTLRLFLDGHGDAWAIVECDGCNGVHKYPAQIALAGPITCADCKVEMEVGPTLLSELTRRRKPFDRDPVIEGSSAST